MGMQDFIRVNQSQLSERGGKGPANRKSGFYKSWTNHNRPREAEKVQPKGMQDFIKVEPITIHDHQREAEKETPEDLKQAFRVFDKVTL